MGSDKFEEELKGLKKDLKKFSPSQDSNFEDKLNELKSGMEKIDKMDIPTSEDITPGSGNEEKNQEEKSGSQEDLTGDTAQKDELKENSNQQDTQEPSSKKQSQPASTSQDAESTEAPGMNDSNRESEPEETGTEKQEEAEKSTSEPDEKEPTEALQQKEDNSPQEEAEKEPGSGSPTDEKIDTLHKSIQHLDKAIKNLITIFNRATNELEDDSESELSEKMDKIIKQNEKILSKLDSSDSGEEKKEPGEQPAQGGSPFMPKPHLPPEMKPIKQNEAPKPPEEDDHIPKLKPRKSKNDV